MKNRKLLVSSMIMILVCCLFFAGTTFAWFSDSVSSNNNVISAGNLDVELEYSYDAEDWKTVDADTYVFDQEALWEPGYTEYVFLRVSNKGSLSLKYTLALKTTEEAGTNVSGKEYKLSDYLTVSAVVSDELAAGKLSKEAAAAILANGANEVGFGVVSKSASLLRDEADYIQLVISMPTTVGNEANPQKGKEASISFALDLIASQLNNEQDSFGPDYDEAAPWVGGVSTDWYLENPTAVSYSLDSAEDLAGLAAIVNGTAENPLTRSAVKDNFKGKTLTLSSDLDLQGIEWTPIGTNANPFLGNLDGAGHTIYNLNVNNDGWAGLVGHAGKSSGSTISNLTVVNATITSNRMAGVIVGQIYGNVVNCHVENANIIVTPNLVSEDKYDNGDKVGGIVGWLGDNGNNRTLANCSATNVYIEGYRDLGGIAGYVASSTTVKENSVNGLTIYGDQITYFYEEKDFNMGAICGRRNGTVTESNNVSENVTIKGKSQKDGVQFIEEPTSEGTVKTLYVVTEDYAEDTLVVPDGVTNIGGYAFAYNSNINKILLSSTVKTLNDRAFRDTSASEVVLNEGLENISYQAFRNALNVESVVIPSTVTTISKEAFQNSGIKTLTIPSSVTSLEYGACRDMKELVKVIIEGDAEIPSYGFRSCTNLKTVVITNPNITFASGMIFSHFDSGISNGLTIYVPTEEVKARLMAADSSARYYTIVVASPLYEASDIHNATSNGQDVLFGSDITGELTHSTIYGTPAVLIQKGGEINGNGYELVVSNPKYEGYAIETYGGTIKNLSILSSVGRGIIISNPQSDVTIDNVVIDGPGYAINTTEHNGKKLVVSNSTVNGWTSLAGLESAIFTNCKLGLNTYGYWQRFGYDIDYDRLFRPYINATLINCQLEQGYYIDLSALGSSCTVTIENCVVNGVVITAENYSSYITIELPGGRTLADCVVFK